MACVYYWVSSLLRCFFVIKLPTQLRPGVGTFSHRYDYGGSCAISMWVVDRYSTRTRRYLLEVEGSRVSCVLSSPFYVWLFFGGVAYLWYIQVIADQLAGAFTMGHEMGHRVNADSAPSRLLVDGIFATRYIVPKGRTFVSIANLNAASFSATMIRLTHFLVL